MPNEHDKLPWYIAPRSTSLVSVEEKKRKAIFKNSDKSRVLVVTIDGGMIQNGERADYVVAHPTIVDVIVELKGSDVSKAVSQIRATHPVWKEHEYCGARVGALIVRGHGIHPTLQTNIQRWKREFEIRLKTKLIVSTQNREYDFEEFHTPGND